MWVCRAPKIQLVKLKLHSRSLVSLDRVPKLIRKSSSAFEFLTSGRSVEFVKKLRAAYELFLPLELAQTGCGDK